MTIDPPITRERFAELQNEFLGSFESDLVSRSKELPELGLSVGLLEAGDGDPVIMLHEGYGIGTDWAPLMCRLDDAFLLYARTSRGMGSPIPSITVTGISVITPCNSWQECWTHSISTGLTRR